MQSTYSIKHLGYGTASVAVMIAIGMALGWENCWTVGYLLYFALCLIFVSIGLPALSLVFGLSGIQILITGFREKWTVREWLAGYLMAALLFTISVIGLFWWLFQVMAPILESDH